MTRLEAKMLDALERIVYRADSIPPHSTPEDALADIRDIAGCAIADTKIQIALGRTE